MAIANVNTNSSAIDSLSINKKTETKKNNNELGQAAFLELMITQMKNQNPLEPQDNSEFVAQLAQFSSVEGLERLNKNFTSFMSTNALQASSLVGRSVSVETDTSTLLNGGLISGMVDLDYSSKDAKISIYDDVGSLVQTIPLGELSQGENVFRWDGQNIEVNGKLLDWKAPDNGAPVGVYKFQVTATQNGKQESLKTSLSANVNSVSINEDGELVLNLAGIGPVNVKDVKQFN
jgi:flagellar basal-body rod modification protein FlgD